jgi:hypothetical protein
LFALSLQLGNLCNNPRRYSRLEPMNVRHSLIQASEQVSISLFENGDFLF